MADTNNDDLLASANLITELTFSGLENTVELKDTVQNLMPDSVNVVVNNIKGIPERFQANLAANLLSEEHVSTFISDYCRKNNETFFR